MLTNKNSDELLDKIELICLTLNSSLKIQLYNNSEFKLSFLIRYP